MDADFLLIRRMKQGEDYAFDIFIRKYYETILNYCAYHCSDAAYAEDLTQETFVRFFTKLSDYHFRGKTKNYLYTIAGNLCKNYYKKAKDISMESEQLESIEYIEKNSENEVINKIFVEWALKQLEPQFEIVIILYFFHGMKLTEIAETLQIGLPLVKYRFKRAKKKLGELMQEGDGYL